MVDFKKASVAGRIVDEIVEKLRSKKEFDQIFDIYEDMDDLDELCRDLKAIAYRHLKKEDKSE